MQLMQMLSSNLTRRDRCKQERVHAGHAACMTQRARLSNAFSAGLMTANPSLQIEEKIRLAPRVLNRLFVLQALMHSRKNGEAHADDPVDRDEPLVKSIDI